MSVSSWHLKFFTANGYKKKKSVYPQFQLPPTSSCRLHWQFSVCLCVCVLAQCLSPQDVQCCNPAACAVVQPSGSQQGAPDTSKPHLPHSLSPVVSNRTTLFSALEINVSAPKPLIKRTSRPLFHVYEDCLLFCRW